MSKPMVRIHNIETDEIIDREMNDDEYTEYLRNQEIRETNESELAAKKIARQTILDRLGLTEDEAKILFG